MIVFDLRCGCGHVFEAWFASSAAYEEQQTRALVRCPLCESATVTKAVMAPNIPAKGNARSAALTAPLPVDPAMPVDPAKVIAAIIAHQSAQLEKSEWVGRSFPDRARAMHLGDEVTTPIHGETSAAEARELAEEGVPIAPLLVPFVPPSARN
ncbi:MAG: DUF1178 family protein [Sphingomonas sp.]|uniref:DUF1178 family protein n=1 Tax=Sphingomonas sp. TaxID=28214 RepID=UPI000DB80DDE|nr:DUF1178 domain-containing protein [Zymomonas sp.]MBA4048299.1 DUF1178 domain-containing protein [Sphingomonas sp.]MBA4772494.1 DUF1178 family protein [Sphingomonas sp.]PZP12420.1 MAG: DUF1178 domain-containing protein [Sphingomonas hengshuiensis]